ncbi:unnamed protein product [Oncorhynchus mykiss]|uniref:Uncharacterized protein n=1 Tax=Oncorhynchus mykiss TaxID=8022 RepID=A0A060Z0J0_ONCMY|nr:unnamed protein product [Oncorhynchus mykiss]
METPLKRKSSGSSSSSSTPSSKGGSNERGANQAEGSGASAQETKEENRDVTLTRPSRPAVSTDTQRKTQPILFSELTNTCLISLSSSLVSVPPIFLFYFLPLSSLCIFLQLL